jgi:hypothetical protein
LSEANRRAHRGTSWISVVLGWLAALGAALILSGIVGAIVAVLGIGGGATGGGITGLVGVLLTLLIAFFLRGHTAEMYGVVASPSPRHRLPPRGRRGGSTPARHR